jgi:hypothetical protein
MRKMFMTEEISKKSDDEKLKGMKNASNERI